MLIHLIFNSLTYSLFYLKSCSFSECLLKKISEQDHYSILLTSSQTKPCGSTRTPCTVCILIIIQAKQESPEHLPLVWVIAANIKRAAVQPSCLLCHSLRQEEVRESDSNRASPWYHPRPLLQSVSWGNYINAASLAHLIFLLYFCVTLRNIEQSHIYVSLCRPVPIQVYSLLYLVAGW